MRSINSTTTWPLAKGRILSVPVPHPAEFRPPAVGLPRAGGEALFAADHDLDCRALGPGLGQVGLEAVERFAGEVAEAVM